MKKTLKISCIILIVLLIHSCCKKEESIPPINFNPVISYGSITDQDGNTYKTVIIGTQTWMAENLKTTRYRNGDLIPNVTDNAQWINLTTGAFCWYNNDISYKGVYGALYNWFTVIDDRSIAPIGWHVPNEGEWEILVTYLGGGAEASKNLRENGTMHWADENAKNANQSGFTGLPAGFRDKDGLCFGINFYGSWWSSDTYEDNTENAWNRGLNWWTIYEPEWNNVNNMDSKKTYGLSIRCIKDN